MCKRNSPDKNEAIMGCVRETLQIKNEASTGCVRETLQIKMKPAWGVAEKLPRLKKKKKKVSMGPVRETPHTKINLARDV